ncbi:hypothetical protein ICL16_34075 [Iningainema sp. BLCCT55]|uniref:Topoisomerase 6 subunit A/Spo11 TOPRIM domain-containing protein n=2 Tax=Iningainema TaxID=1932705 RepID=A0A8J6XSY6_9CYAN|nr:hypothetical protein [Iningainema tapete]MBD2776946.1 hypothetical protein [Iningainema tapete BLCC-T55]
MKCINCGTDNNLKDRTANQGRCTNCNHRFVFEPTTMGNVKITDPMFAKAIADLSAHHSLFFTPKQLLYFLDHRLRSKSFSSVWGWLLTYLFFNIWVTIFFGGILGWLFAAIKISGNVVVNLIFQICYIYYLYSNTNSHKLNNKSRKASARSLQIIGVIILVVGIYASVAVYESFILFVIYVILGMLSIYLGTKQLRQTGLTQEFLFTQNQFQDWMNSWSKVNGSVVKMLPSLREERILPAAVNPDVTAYSFDRLIVCDSAAIAQLLIANNFHFENNCAILSITGYPQSIFATTMQMLRRNPDLNVYALHDCSPRGISLVHQLRTSTNWFYNSNVMIIDVGILPHQIIAAKRGMFIQTSQELAQEAKQLPIEVRQSLSTQELEWLESGNFVELESFTPQTLIQILHRSIAGSRELDSNDSSFILVGDSGSGIYAVENFG